MFIFCSHSFRLAYPNWNSLGCDQITSKLPYELNWRAAIAMDDRQKKFKEVKKHKICTPTRIRKGNFSRWKWNQLSFANWQKRIRFVSVWMCVRVHEQKSEWMHSEQSTWMSMYIEHVELLSWWKNVVSAPCWCWNGRLEFQLDVWCSFIKVFEIEWNVGYNFFLFYYFIRNIFWIIQWGVIERINSTL